MIARALSLLVSLARAAYAGVLLGQVDAPIVVGFALLECVMAAWSAVNAVVAVKVDATWRGYVALAVYSVGFVVQPEATMNDTLQLALWPIVYLRCWALVSMGLCVTCGVSTYLATVTAGPFAYVRHPMQLSGILARLVFFIAWPTGVNALGLSMMLLGSVLIVIAEELFLREFESWRDYAAGVRFRLIPYVW